MRKRILSFLIFLLLGFNIVQIENYPSTIYASGTDNIKARANYLYGITWTAQSTIKGWRNNYAFNQGETHRIPYGQPVTQGKYIYWGTTIDSFLNSTKNLNSEFYTTRSYYSGNSGSYSTYYAMDCSAFVSYCWDLPNRTTTSGWSNLSVTSYGKCTTSNINKLQIGDALNLAGSHIVLVSNLEYSNGNISKIEITEQTPPEIKRSYYTPSSLSSKYSNYTIYRYNKRDSVTAPPNYEDNSQPAYYNPEGYVDICTGGVNSVYVKGWAFDRDDTSQSLQIHIYIGGGAGDPNAEGYPITANIYRDDVNKVYGISGNHGFEATIPTSKIGTQDVYIYACNIGGGTNQFFGSYTVNITNETEHPTISDIQITNLTDTGYTISCKVSDNSGIKKVSFPVWTDYNSQDDIIWGTGELNGDIATFKVNISDHNNEHGVYHAHIYAYDIYENSHFVMASSVFIPINATPTKEVTVNNKKYILYENENKLMWHEAKLFCEQQGGYLATITSAEEQELISSMLVNTTCAHYFLGGTKNDEKWQWISGEKWNYTNWNSGEPNNKGGNENILVLLKNELQWNDNANSPTTHCGFICEIDLPYTKTTITDYGKYKLCTPELFNIENPCTIIVSSYKGDELTSCETRESDNNDPFVLLGDIDTVKVMLWDSLSGLKPLSETEIITIN